MGSAVGLMGRGARARGRQLLLVLLAKDVVSLQINTEIDKSWIGWLGSSSIRTERTPVPVQLYSCAGHNTTQTKYKTYGTRRYTSGGLPYRTVLWPWWVLGRSSDDPPYHFPTHPLQQKNDVLGSVFCFLSFRTSNNSNGPYEKSKNHHQNFHLSQNILKYSLCSIFFALCCAESWGMAICGMQ